MGLFHVHGCYAAIADDSSTGPGGRVPKQLKRVPLWIWNRVAQGLELIFLKDATWLEKLMHANVAFMPKASNGPQTPSSHRDRWCPPRSVEVAQDLTLFAPPWKLGSPSQQRAPLVQQGLLLVSLDLSKFFCSIEWGMIDGLAEQFWMPATKRGAFMRFLSRFATKFFWKR